MSLNVYNRPLVLNDPHQMIEEARIMAETPDPGTVEGSQDDINQDGEVSSRKSSTNQGMLLSYYILQVIYPLCYKASKDMFTNLPIYDFISFCKSKDTKEVE